MSRTLQSPRHEALRVFLIEQRRKAGLTQAQLAERLGRTQPLISDVEQGQRRIDAVELIEWAEAIGFDPIRAIRWMQKATA